MTLVAANAVLNAVAVVIGAASVAYVVAYVVASAVVRIADALHLTYRPPADEEPERFRR